MQVGVSLLVLDVMPIYDHCLGYHHNYLLFYELSNSNLFTHRMLFSREKLLVKSMAPGLSSIILISRQRAISIALYFAIFIFQYIQQKYQKYLSYYLYQISLLQVAVKGLTTSLSRWLQGSYLFV